jgi:hypothetical protein
MKLSEAILLVVVFGLAAVLSSAPIVQAQGPPPVPHAFYGTVELNGKAAPVGCVIEARGEGVLTGIQGNPLVLTNAGRYGAKTNTEPKLVVQGDLQDGVPLRFYINGVRAMVARPGESWQDTYPFESGLITELNLSATGYKVYLPLIRR